MKTPSSLEAWVVGADMGYGHLRAVHPLRHIAHQGVIVVGKNDAADEDERRLWARLLSVYELFSRSRAIPVVGKPLFSLLDRLLRIPSYYPIRDLSRSTFQVELLASSIRKGLCRGLLEKIEQRRLPLVTSFYAPAVAADAAGYDRVYCIVCDADLNRVWVAKNPEESRITYFAPCGRAAQRLRSYGVPQERIFLTGFPLPQELLGPGLRTLRSDLLQRLVRLDPRGRFRAYHGRSVQHFLGKDLSRVTAEAPLTITYAVGGAGAQKEFGARLARSLSRRIASGEIRLNLVAGIRRDVFEYFDQVRTHAGSAAAGIHVLYDERVGRYFEQFNALLRRTDILWTKPSELSFYTALGIPIVMSPTLGSQEKFNRRWLEEIHAGTRQEHPDVADQWITDRLQDGFFAENAWSGFLKGRKLGTAKILEVLSTGSCTPGDTPLTR
jgi:hypothetical protein